jgi:hypothetical protein
VVLFLVQVERCPAGAEFGPGRDGVACDQEASFRPVEGEVSGRVAGGANHVQRSDGVALVE